MKILTRVQTVLTEGATDLEAAASAASDALASQIPEATHAISDALDSVTAQLQELSAQLTELPTNLDPGSALEDFTEALKKAQPKFGEFSKRLLTAGEGIVRSTQALEPLPADIQSFTALLADVPTRLSDLLPDLSPLLSKIKLARETGESVVIQVKELYRKLESLRDSHQTDPSKRSTAQPLLKLRSELTTLRNQLDEDIRFILQHLGDEAASLAQALTDAETNQENLLEEVRAESQKMTTRFTEALSEVDAGITPLLDELDEIESSLHELTASLTKPIRDIEEVFDHVLEQIDAVEHIVDTVVESIDTEIDRVESLLETMFSVLDAAVMPLDNVIHEIQKSLSDLDSDLDTAEATLKSIPDHFEPVRNEIQEAIVTIESVRDGIPGFVSQALSALEQADSELDQAGSRCDGAIAICTEYMPQAPPLGLAKSLFQGVKSSLPAIHDSVSQAKSAVNSAGDNATQLLNLAIGQVEGLNPILDEALSEVDSAIQVTVSALGEVRSALAEADRGLASASEQMNAMIDSAKVKPRELIDLVRSTRDSALESIQPKERLGRIRDAIQTLKDETASAARIQVEAYEAQAAEVIDQVRAKLKEAHGNATAFVSELDDRVSDLCKAALKPSHELKSLIDTTSEDLRRQSEQCEASLAATLDQLDRRVGTIADNVGLLDDESGPEAVRDTLKALPLDKAELTALKGSVDVIRSAASAASSAVEDHKARSSASQTPELSNEEMDALQAEADSLQRLFEDASDHSKKSLGDPELDRIQEETQRGLSAIKRDAEEESRAATEASRAPVSQIENSKDRLDTLAEDAAAASGVAEPKLKDIQEHVDNSLDRASEAAGAATVQIQSSSEDVVRQASAVHADAEKKKNESAEQIEEALSKVNSVKAQTNAARADVVSAEAVVDAEVVKNGGAAAARDENGVAQSAKANDKESSDEEQKDLGGQVAESNESSQTPQGEESDDPLEAAPEVEADPRVGDQAAPEDQTNLGGQDQAASEGEASLDDRDQAASEGEASLDDRDQAVSEDQTSLDDRDQAVSEGEASFDDRDQADDSRQKEYDEVSSELPSAEKDVESRSDRNSPTKAHASFEPGQDREKNARNYQSQGDEIPTSPLENNDRHSRSNEDSDPALRPTEDRSAPDERSTPSAIDSDNDTSEDSPHDRRSPGHPDHAPSDSTYQGSSTTKSAEEAESSSRMPDSVASESDRLTEPPQAAPDSAADTSVSDDSPTSLP